MRKGRLLALMLVLLQHGMGEVEEESPERRLIILRARRHSLWDQANGAGDLPFVWGDIAFGCEFGPQPWRHRHIGCRDPLHFSDRWWRIGEDA